MDNLGYTEVIDQVAAAREVAKRRYVDRAKIGIWGWVSTSHLLSPLIQVNELINQSYGGFMTCKTVEADSGVFSLGSMSSPPSDHIAPGIADK
jgi:dipeptidyl aminopeptidase